MNDLGWTDISFFFFGGGGMQTMNKHILYNNKQEGVEFSIHSTHFVFINMLIAGVQYIWI